MRRRWRSSPIPVFCYLVDEGAFFCVLAVARTILVFFIATNNYDEEEATSIAYVSILLSCG
jgi:hypothetical protein